MGINTRHGCDPWSGGLEGILAPVPPVTPPPKARVIRRSGSSANQDFLIEHAKKPDKLPHAKYRKTNDFTKLLVFRWLTVIPEGDMLRGQRCLGIGAVRWNGILRGESRNCWCVGEEGTKRD